MKPRLPCLLDFAFRSPCLAAKALQIAGNTKTVKVIKGEGSCDSLLLDKEDIDLAIDGGEKFLEVNLDKRQYCSQTIMLQTQDGEKQVIEQLNYMDGMQFELNQVFIKSDDGGILNPTTDSMQKGKSYKIAYLCYIQLYMALNCCFCLALVA